MSKNRFKSFVVILLSVQKVQLHWSSIVGASHTNDYVVWDYGQYASRGVKEVCEYGFSNNLETEFKRNVSTASRMIQK